MPNSARYVPTATPAVASLRQDSENTTEASVAATFLSSVQPGDNDNKDRVTVNDHSNRINAWNLASCAAHVDVDRTTNDAPLCDHPDIDIDGIDFEDVTYAQCTVSYRDQLTSCHKDYKKKMGNWPPKHSPGPFFTSGDLSYCLSTLNADAVTDYSEMTDGEPDGYVEDYCVIVHYYTKISRATRHCL